VLRAGAAVFGFVFFVHALSPALTSGDSRWTVPVALSLLERGDTNLDEYLDLIRENGYYAAECIRPPGAVVGSAMGDCTGGHIYNWYPIGVPVLAAPVVFVIRAALDLAGPWLAHPALFGIHPIIDAFLRADLVGSRALVEMIVASFFIALAAAFMFLLARRFLPARWAVGLALVFAFATPAWSTASRALWQHGPSMLMTTIILWLLARAERRAIHFVGAGAAAALGYTVRPTNLLLLVVIALFVLRHDRRFFLAYAAGAAAALACFLTYNFSVYERALPSYYSLTPPPLDSWRAVAWILHSLAAQLVSPNRGLLIFTPVFLFSLAGLWRALRTRWLAPLPAYLAVLTVLQIAVVARFYQFWVGGHSYGPRLTSDLTPVLVFLLIPLFADWSRAGFAPRRTLGLFGAAILFSVFVHARGALSMETHRWNIDPVNVDHHQQRVWDWRDLQFLRGIVMRPSLTRETPASL
jgi:hypothetical protein